MKKDIDAELEDIAFRAAFKELEANFGVEFMEQFVLERCEQGLRELEAMGLVYDTGERIDGLAVYRAVEKPSPEALLSWGSRRGNS